MRNIILSLSLIVLCISCSQKKTPTQGVIAEKAMVVSARAEASQIGLDILQKGGNAFDAMVATELALAVAYPYAGNISGGGFMVYRNANGEHGGIDYREKAPLAAFKDMYLDSLGNPDANKSRFGAMAVGVPGTVAGIAAVHEKFGTLPFSELVQPAIDLARKGVIVTKKQEDRIKRYQEKIIEISGDSTRWSNAFKERDTIKYDNIAETLSLIRDYGRDGFYTGPTAEKIVAFLSKRGGIITLEDLQAYQARWRDPVVFDYDDLTVISMSPPSSGGVCLAQMMQMVEPFNLHEFGHNQPATMQVMIEAERRAYADRSYYLGDPDFVEIPMETLIDTSYLRSRMADFSMERATKSSAIKHGQLQFAESMETTHYSIVDQFGNAVSVTTTLNGAYGGKLYSEELGFFFNNEMDDFSAKPGVPNMFGLIGAEANAIAPEKRMLSSMTPTIVEKEGQLWMVVGTPGGSTIITSVFQTILNVHEHSMGMQEAVDAPRFHHQWLPDIVMLEPNVFSTEVKGALQAKGYELTEERTPVIGKVDAILVLEDGKLEGGADKRGDDTAVGF